MAEIWGAAIAAVGAIGGGIISANGAKAAAKAGALPQNYYNQYGQVNTENTGAITSMNDIFSQINGADFNGKINAATGRYAGALNSAADDPGLASIYDYGMKSLSGDYLQNSLTNKYADQVYTSQLAAGADQAAKTHSKFSRAGLGFSTGNQQAEDADMAAAAARGSLNRAQILSQNYQFERANQQAAPGIITGALGARTGFLGAIPGALYSPYGLRAGITSQLTGGGSASNPTYLQQPNLSSQIASGVQTASSIYDLYKNFASRPKSSSTASFDGDLLF